MLIHDIYQRNVMLDRTIPAKFMRPFKIVYADKAIEVDTRSFEEFVDPTTSEEPEGGLFKHLGMPISTSSTSPPFAVVGSNEKHPYVEFWGVITIDNGSVTITIDNKRIADNKVIAPLARVSLDVITKKKPEYNVTSAVIQSRVLGGYRAGGYDLVDIYKKSAIFNGTDQFVLPKKYVKEICDKFFDFIVPKTQSYISESSLGDTDRPGTKSPKHMTFMVLVLPTKEAITWDISGRQADVFEDVFGHESAELAPNKTTFNSKFLSPDDPSFTMKCRKNAAGVYDNLNLSKQSYMRINLHNEDLFSLSRLLWYFGTNTDVKNRKRQPRETETEEQKVRLSGIKKHGFYAQIRDMSEVGYDDHRIMCLKRDNSKVEILLDEYCPLKAIGDRLLRDKNGHLRYSKMAFESLIIDNDWSLYMDAVRALLHGRKVTRHRIVSRLTYAMRKKIRTGTSVADLATFFSRSSFCLEAIGSGGGSGFAGLGDDEHFAHCVGVAAMHFARLRLGRNPERDELMRRPVYDRANLRRVLSTVVSGLALRLDDRDAQTALEGCSMALSWAKCHEIKDRESRADLSYFFLMGAYSVLRSDRGNKGVERNAGAG